MRVPECKECMELQTITDIQYRFNSYARGKNSTSHTIGMGRLKKLAIKWWKHFDSKPNLMNMASCRTIADIFDLTDEDLK